MKKADSIFLSIIFVLVGLLALFVVQASVLWDTNRALYPATMRVERIDEATNTVTLVNANGFVWQFQGVEDWAIGDLASCLMNDQGTDSILDDELVSVKYSGYIIE